MVYSSENFYKTFELVRKRVPYKICIKTINPEEILLRSNIKDLNEITTFIQAYEAVTYSRFRIISNKSAQTRRKWICNHSVVSGISEKCPASISILIKKNNKQNRLKDAFLRRNPPHPAVIKINPNHNHPLMTPLAPYKLLKVNNDVKECFYEYFKRGYYGARAKGLHEQYLRKANFFAFGDESMNPNLPAVFTLYNNWLKMNECMQVDTVTGNESSGLLQTANVEENEGEASSSQNLENFINMDDILSKLKKEPDDECVASGNNCTNEIIEDIKPVLNIKQEIIDEDEGLPVISSYGSVAAPPTPALSETVVTSTAKPSTTKMTVQNVAAVVKRLPLSSSQVVVYDQSSNTYKVVKCLAVNTGSYSPSQYKSYLPSTLLPARISLQKL